MDLTEVALNTSAYNEPPSLAEAAWRGSKFERFYNIPSPVAKGVRGERLVADVLEECCGESILRHKKTNRPTRMPGTGKGYDICATSGGMKIEVKTSLAWGGVDNQFTWQQIRTLQDYDRVVFVGINPDSLQMWWAGKQDILDNLAGQDRYRQHGGKSGKQDLYWIRNEVPTWFKEMSTWK